MSYFMYYKMTIESKWIYQLWLRTKLGVAMIDISGRGNKKKQWYLQPHRNGRKMGEKHVNSLFR